MKKQRKICAIIPAHNEEKNIKDCVLDLLNQNRSFYKIFVVDDFSTDKTATIVNQLKKEHKNLCLLHTTDHNLRAGAINEGLRHIQENISDCWAVLVTDADCKFDFSLVTEGEKALNKNPSIGGVCSIAGTIKPDFNNDKLFTKIKKWFLWRFQKLEYAGFDSIRTASWKNVMILHGLCSMFRFDAIMQVGGYQPNHLLEDYKLTLALKKSGWKTHFAPGMIAYTNPLESFKSLAKQRLRWMRGGVEIIYEEGVNKYTREDVFNHLMFVFMFITILSIVISRTIFYGWSMGYNSNLLAMILALGGYTFSLYNLRYVKNIDIFDVIMRIIILPELFLAMFYSCLQIKAYCMFILKTNQDW